MKKVLDYLKELLNAKDTVIVATSGGPDSMCLLDLLLSLKDKLNLNLIVAHVNHKLREESEEEYVFVKEYAKNHGLLFEYMEIKEYDHDNLENAARKKRYEFFAKLVNKYHAKYLMTAHHSDDLIETILMRLVRGSSIKGYSGFRQVTDMGDYKIVRPLILVSKDDILKYMEDNNLKYYVDKSNFSLEYTRNRYRSVVLPFLKKEQENVGEKFLKFSRELESLSLFLDSYIKDLEQDIKSDEGIDIAKLLRLDEFIIKKVIEYELSLIYINDLFLVSDKNTSDIIKLIRNKKNGYVILPNNYIAIKDYNNFRIEHNNKEINYYYELDDVVNVPGGIIKKINSSDNTSNYIIRLNSLDIKLPIIVRSRKPGDKIEVKNMKGSKKVKDIFIDEKVSLKKRKNFPIVTDSENRIIWLPGVKKSKFDVARDGIYDIILAYEEEK